MGKSPYFGNQTWIVVNGTDLPLYDFSLFSDHNLGGQDVNLVNLLLESYWVGTNNAPPMRKKHFQR